MWTFRAMDTDVTVAAPSATAERRRAITREVARVFAEAEVRFSRFRSDSELAVLNRSAGDVAVSPEMLGALLAARRHVAATGGLFDPAVGGALAALGYDRTFDELDPPSAVVEPPRARFDELAIDERAGIVTRPAHVQIDLGGIVKGRTVDRAAALLPAPGFVEAGGDAVLRGGGVDGEGWPVDVEDPADPCHVVVTLRVTDRAVATSAPNRRRWFAAGTPVHHLIDPRSARPAVSDLAQATVIAATAEEADVLAKVAFLLGARDGRAFLERRGVAGVLLGVDRAVHLVGDVEVDDA
jgi:thiamine biosynthesis lipoprotein